MPNRILREGILTSERVNRIADRPAVEVTYRRLYSVADDYGRFSAHPSLLRAALYPLRIDQITDAEVMEHLRACASAGLVNLYEVEGKPYLEILDFRQQLRSKRSKFPAPDTHMHSTCDTDAHHANVIRIADADTCCAYDQRMCSETETEADIERRESEAARNDGAMPLDEFFEERYRRHPRKRDRTLAEQALGAVAGIETRDVQERFRVGHEAWIGCEEWRWRNGAKAPSFADFITDRTWQYPPPDGNPDLGDPFDQAASVAIGRQHKEAA